MQTPNHMFFLIYFPWSIRYSHISSVLKKSVETPFLKNRNGFPFTHNIIFYKDKLIQNVLK